MGVGSARGARGQAARWLYRNAFSVCLYDISELRALLQRQGMTVVSELDWTEPVLGGCTRRGLSANVRKQLRVAGIPFPYRWYSLGWFTVQAEMLSRGGLGYFALVAEKPRDCGS